MLNFTNDIKEAVEEANRRNLALKKPEIKLDTLQETQLKRIESDLNRSLESNLRNFNQILNSLKLKGVDVQKVKEKFIKTIEIILRGY